MTGVRATPVLLVAALCLAQAAAGAQAQPEAPPPVEAPVADPAPAAVGFGVEDLLLGEPAGTPLSGEELDRATEQVAAKMRCPVCQGLSVADSPTDSAIAMKREVRRMLSEGYTPEQVLSYFERSYGEFIRLAPKPEGLNLLVWIAPVLALAAGAGLVALYFRRRPRPRAAAASPAEDPELEAYRERVRREVGT